MSTTLELIQVRLLAVLGTLEGVTVTRRRTDPFEIEELPAIEILRGAASSEDFGGRADKWRPSFSLHLIVADDAQAEAALDALHQLANQALFEDVQLVQICKGLRCTGVGEPEQVATTEGVAARMACAYEAQLLTRRGDLSRAMT